MKIDEEAFLRKLSGIIDDPSIEKKALEEIEKKSRERKLLEQFERALTHNKEKLHAAEEMLEQLEEAPVATLIEDIPPQPVLPVADFATPTVQKLMDTPQKDYEKIVSKMKDGLQKEIDLIKKTVVDLHQFATGLSNMGGGGEVNLRWLDDVDRSTIDDNHFLRYNSTNKKFEFYDFVAQGGYMGDFEIVNNHINLLRPTNTDVVIVPTGNGSLVVPTAIHTNNMVANTANLVYLSIVNPNFTATESIVRVFGSNGTPQPLSNPGALAHFVNQANTPARIIIDTYGNTAYGVIAGRKSRGTIDTPTAVQANDVMFRIASNGFGNTGFNTLGAASIDFVATENFTDTSRGAKIVFNATTNGSNSTIVVTSIESDGIHLGHVYSPTGNITNLHITGGSNDQIMVSDGAGNFIWRNRHEDGTWTPVMFANTGSNIEFNVTNASYLKFGPLVNMNFDINVSSMGTAAGTLQFDGLPFPGKNTSGYVGTVTISRFTNLVDGGIITITGAVIGGNNRSDMWATKIQGQILTIPSLAATDLQVGSRLIGSILYDTDF